MDNEAPNSDQIEEVAVRWFARQQSGSWTHADQAEFETWLHASTAHRIQYIRVTTAWDHSARMKALGAGVAPGVIPPRGSWGDGRFSRGASPWFQPSPDHDSIGTDEHSRDLEATPEFEAEVSETARARQSRRHRRAGLFTAAAALVAVIVGISTFQYGLFTGTRYSTPVGGMDEVTLADGSHVTLNTDTRIRVSLTDGERRIQLERGEAFFEVAKDRSRPFVVYAGDKRVMAVGTKFSVRREDNDVQVVVLEGRVNLSASAEQALVATNSLQAPGTQAAPGATTAIPPPTSLDAGAIARTSNSEVLVRPDAVAEAEKLLSWRRGYLYFDNMSLADAVAEFNRYNTRQIVIVDPDIADLRIGGNFRANNIDAFLDLMQNGFPITVEQDGASVVMKAR